MALNSLNAHLYSNMTWMATKMQTQATTRNLKPVMPLLSKLTHSLVHEHTFEGSKYFRGHILHSIHTRYESHQVCAQHHEFIRNTAQRTHMTIPRPVSELCCIISDQF